MMGRIKRAARSNVVGFVALFFVLTGGAFALPGRNTVDSGDIAPKNVYTSDLAPSAVTTGKVRDGSLLSKDFADGQLPQGERGPRGETGPPGPANGPAGGDLSGTYPNPQITALAVTLAKMAPDAVNSGIVVDDSLTGDDINESTLGKVGDADTLDGIDSSGFLRSDAAAGGDLTGNYPAPSLATDAVQTDEIQNSQVTEGKLSFDPTTQAEFDAFLAVLDGEGTDSTPNEATDPVSWFKIKDLTSGGDGVITGAFIKDGTITADDLASDSVGTSELQAGAVTADKQTANAQAGTTGTVPVSAGTPVTVTSAGLNVTGGHKVSLAGQAQITCGNCLTAADTLDVTFSLRDNGVQVNGAGPYTISLTAANPTAMLPVSALAAEPAGPAAAHTFGFYVSVTGHGSASSATATNPTLTAVDLGA